MRHAALFLAVLLLPSTALAQYDHEIFFFDRGTATARIHLEGHRSELPVWICDYEGPVTYTRVGVACDTVDLGRDGIVVDYGYRFKIETVEPVQVQRMEPGGELTLHYEPFYAYTGILTGKYPPHPTYFTPDRGSGTACCVVAFAGLDGDENLLRDLSYEYDGCFFRISAGVTPHPPSPWRDNLDMEGTIEIIGPYVDPVGAARTSWGALKATYR